ncbi:uncharacterized protein LOC135495543 isoform X2 [Lineus longissimus]|uniref:uncharacterized protein LOC135495543 isoform X2 n=1 Tax=Lineus longissimus TaxID=88925 RepID=UPI00315D91E1
MDDSEDFPDQPSELILNEEPPKDDLYVWVFYKGSFVWKCRIKEESGCVIRGSCKADKETDDEEELYTRMDRLQLTPQMSRRTDEGWVIINLPEPSSVDDVRPRHLDRINKGLDSMGDGIRIKRNKENGCIYGEKLLNSCHIYHAYPMIELEYTQTECLPLALPNMREKCLFNPENYWRRFDANPNRHERPKAVLSIGERWSLTKSLETCSISMTVINAQDLYKYQQMIPCQIEVSPDTSLEYMGTGEGACDAPIRKSLDCDGGHSRGESHH